MIRPFSLRDLPLVRRLSDQGTLLHAEAALTRSCQPLRGALFNMISRRDSATYIWREEGGNSAGFVQLYLPEDQAHAHLLCLGATDPDEEQEAESPINETAWLSLLEGAIVAMGQRGIHSLIAEVAESGPELPVLRRAGFAVYTRQDIWVFQGTPQEDIEIEGRALLELAQKVDEWDVEWLYANTVPPLIQLVEPAPPQNGQIWILRDAEELTAFVHIQEGSVATWIQIFIHPSAHEQSAAIVKAAIALSNGPASNTVYCCVRRYQSWLQHALADNGFQRCKSQAVMVKHIATPAQQKAGELSKLLQAHRAQATSLFEQYGQAPERQPTLARD